MGSALWDNLLVLLCTGISRFPSTAPVIQNSEHLLKSTQKKIIRRLINSGKDGKDLMYCARNKEGECIIISGGMHNINEEQRRDGGDNFQKEVL